MPTKERAETERRKERAQAWKLMRKIASLKVNARLQTLREIHARDEEEQRQEKLHR
jgi:hypothetical protein